MGKAFLVLLVTGAWAGLAGAATIKLGNSADGSGKLDLNGATGELGYMDLLMETSASDTIPIAFINAFLDTEGDCDVLIYEIIPGQDWEYDFSAFELPAPLSEDGGNEFGLVSGDQDGGDSLPLGSATYVIVTLGLGTSDVEGGLDVSFELGARNPQVFGPAPTYAPFTVAPNGFPPGFPNFLYIGDANSNNPPFEINCIPEPAVLGLLVLCGSMVLKRRS